MIDINALLREQISHAYAHAPAIKHLMESVGITPEAIQKPADLGQLPVTSKDKLQEMQQANPPFGGFLGVPMSQLRRIYLSPGPIFDPHGHEDEAGQLSAKEAFTAAGFTSDDIVLNTFMYQMVPAGLLMDEAMALVGATVIPVGPGNTEVQISAIMALSVTAYVGTPSFLQIIYGKAAEMGIAPQNFPLKKAFFSAEPYTPSQRQFFEGECGLVTAQAYATADLGIIAYEKPGQPGLLVPRNLIVQVCSPETGEILEDGQLGEVVVTSLNKTYPLIRFGTGDLSIMETLPDGQKKLQGWMGRSGEAIKVRGMFLHPNALRGASAAFPNIKTIQAVIGREGVRDTVTLQVILSSGELDTQALASAVKDAARLSVDRVEIVEQVQGTRLVRDTRKFD